MLKKYSEYVSDDFNGMTVRELMEVLSKAHPDAFVFVERTGDYRPLRPGTDVRVLTKTKFGIDSDDGDLEEYTGPSVIFTSWD